MRRSMLTAALGLGLTACPSPADPPADSTDSATTEEPTATSNPDGETDPSDTSAGTTEDPWLEVGWGISDFNEFDGTLPVVIGPQGLAMFSMPMRGAGFYNPPDPSFDNPDMPMLHAWVDIPGYEITPDGHFNEVVDYPALFYPSLEDSTVLEGPAVWLVIPDAVDPAEITGLSAQLNVELVDANDLLLTAQHDLVVGDAPEPPPGP